LCNKKPPFALRFRQVWPSRHWGSAASKGCTGFSEVREFRQLLLRPVVVHEQLGRGPGAASGAGVALGRGDDGALDQDVSRPGEIVRVVEAGRFCKFRDLLPRPVQVLDARFPEGVVRARFHQHVQEGADLGRALAEPVVEDVEDGQHGCLVSKDDVVLAFLEQWYLERTVATQNAIARRGTSPQTVGRPRQRSSLEPRPLEGALGVQRRLLEFAHSANTHPRSAKTDRSVCLVLPDIGPFLRTRRRGIEKNSELGVHRTSGASAGVDAEGWAAAVRLSPIGCPKTVRGVQGSPSPQQLYIIRVGKTPLKGGWLSAFQNGRGSGPKGGRVQDGLRAQLRPNRRLAVDKLGTSASPL
jgi:hypothetical protein